MKIHYGVFNLKTKKFGQIEGPANKKTLRVHWPAKDADDSVEDVSISPTIRKVLEGSIEYKALAEPQTCLWLFREHPDEFFATLLNYRDQKLGLVLKESKILGKESAVTPKGKPRSSLVDDSFRDGLRDASGALLFPDFELFKEGWKKAVAIWAKEENPPVLVQLSGKKILSIKPGLEIEIDPNGSIAEGSASSIEEIFDQDLAAVRKWFESYKPSSSLDVLLKAAFTEKPEFKNDSKFWESLAKEELRLPRDFVKKALSLAISSARKDIAPVAKAYSLAKKFEIDPFYLEGDENLDGLAKCARVLAEVENSPLAKIWLTEICSVLENYGFKFAIGKDFVLVESRLKLMKGHSEKNSVLTDLSDWLKLQDSSSSVKNKTLVKASLQSLLSGLNGDFSPARISLLDYCIKNKIDIASESYFSGISLYQLLRENDLYRVVMSDQIADEVGRPVVTRELDGAIELEVLISMLYKGQPLLKLLKKWGLTEQFNSKFSNALSQNSLYQELIVPNELQIQLKVSGDSLKTVQKELASLEKSSKSAQELVERLEAQVSTLKAQLKAAQTANDELLASRVISAMYTTSKAFATSARILRLDGALIPLAQINAVISEKLESAGITTRLKIGDEVSYDPQQMASLVGEIEVGARVEVVDPIYELNFQGETFTLTQALVRSIMRT